MGALRGSYFISQSVGGINVGPPTQFLSHCFARAKRAIRSGENSQTLAGGGVV